MLHNHNSAGFCGYTKRGHPDKILRKILKLPNQESSSEKENGYKHSLTSSYSKFCLGGLVHVPLIKEK